jgi:hypothetical protein
MYEFMEHCLISGGFGIMVGFCIAGFVELIKSIVKGIRNLIKKKKHPDTENQE